MRQLSVSEALIRAGVRESNELGGEDCFAGVEWCDVLVSRYGRDEQGKPTCENCPFFKTRERLMHERIDALYRLSALGLLDEAVKKYGQEMLKI